LSTLTADQVITLLTDYTKQTGVPVDVLLVGALALQAYGYQNRLTRDVDAEVVGSVEALAEFFSQHHIPADLTEKFSGWSIVAKPPGYRERATDLVHHSHLRVRLLAPLDFIIAKLRQGGKTLGHIIAGELSESLGSKVRNEQYQPPAVAGIIDMGQRLTKGTTH
jgi:hypothetical protein